MKNKLFFKYLALLSAITLFPLWLLGYKLMSIGQTSVKTAIMELQMANASAAAEELNNYAEGLSEKTNLLRAILPAGGWQEKMQVFTSFIETSPGVTAASVISAEGREVVRVISSGAAGGGGKLISYAGDKDFARAKAPWDSERFFFSAESGSLVYYCPFANKLYLRVEAALDKPFAALDKYKAGAGGLLVLADPQGRFFVPLLRAARQGSDAAGMREWPVVKHALRNRLGSGAMEFTDAGRDMLGAYAPFRSAGGAVIVVQPLEAAYRQVLFMKKRAVYSVIGVMLLVFLSLAFVSWRLAGRLSGEPVNSEKPLKGFWHSLQSSFKEGGEFPWGRLSLVALAVSIGCVAGARIFRFGGDIAMFLAGLTAFFVFLTCLLIWADKAVARRDIRKAFMLPLRIILKLLAGAAVLGLVWWLGMLVYTAFHGW